MYGGRAGRGSGGGVRVAKESEHANFQGGICFGGRRHLCGGGGGEGEGGGGGGWSSRLGLRVEVGCLL